jgi:hypothetical protein
VDFHFNSPEALHAEIVVVQPDSSQTGGVTRSHYDLDEEQLEKMPLAEPREDLSAVIETVPGVVPEENGRIHVRGAEAAPQYVLDGVPLVENLTGTYSTGLDTENLENTRIITGNIPAEFGDKSAAIVTLRTKSGLDVPWNGSLAFSAGSFDSAAVDAEVGGHFRNVGVFLTADTSRNRRFLDPPEIDNLHNTGGLAHFFSRFDWLLTQKDVVRLTLAANGSTFKYPICSSSKMRANARTRNFATGISRSPGLTPSIPLYRPILRHSATLRPPVCWIPIALAHPFTLNSIAASGVKVPAQLSAQSGNATASKAVSKSIIFHSASILL